MPMYDRICRNGHQTIDCWEPITVLEPVKPCKECGAPTERAWLQRASNVIGDGIPGGELMHHGICNDDGTPKRYYSKSEMARAAAEKGLVNAVRHVPDNKGTDKSKHTTRWI